ncbi:MAG: cytochrome c [Bacteroidetes bacterium]|nr:cytochrome c [Bacteroidota bacterium]
MNQIKSKLFSGLMLLNFMVVAVSCQRGPQDPGTEFMPDMYRSPSYETYAPNALFADSSSARLPVAGTIPRDYTFFHYPPSNDGYAAAGNDLKNPFEANATNTAEGKRLYTNFCMHCHGETGGGDGSLIATGKFPPPPAYATGVSSRGGNMRDLTDGKIFHTITYGVNLMGAHASQLNHEERWKIVMYVHQLGKAGGAINTAASDSTGAPKDSTVALK